MKGIILFVMVFLCIGFVSAKVGSIDTECQSQGFDFGVAKYEWDDGTYALGDHINGYATTASGTAEEVIWTSNPAVDGVLEKEAQNTYVYDGGTSGTISSVSHDISHITLCGLDNQVPEWGFFGGILLIIGCLTGILFFRYRK